jgi:hypothetical protein
LFCTANRIARKAMIREKTRNICTLDLLEKRMRAERAFGNYILIQEGAGRDQVKNRALGGAGQQNATCGTTIY